MTFSHTSRRQFLQASAAAAAATTACLPSASATVPAASADRVPIGLIGAGGMGVGNMRAASKWVDVVAIADVDEGRRNSANQGLSKGKADVYENYEEILERDDISVLHIATPDHWHTKPLIEAMLAGKDVYCEKPLTLTIDEGKLIRRVQKETGRIVQVGTQQRSTFDLFVKAMAIVQEGRLGKIRRLQCAIGGSPTSGPIPVADVPDALNWDRWLGPAPEAPYRQKTNPGSRRGNGNNHYEFRWWYEYSGGKLTDWGAHHVDIAAWALVLNGQNDTPISVGGTAQHPTEFRDGLPVDTDRYNTATQFLMTAAFADGTEMIIRHDTDNGILIEGEKGRIFVNRGKLTGAPVDALKENPLPEDAIARVYKNLPMTENARAAHWACFLHCVKSRQEPISDVHSHMKSLNICHLAGISARLGRTIRWDGAAEQIEGDDQAAAMLSRPYREGYEIQMG